MTDFEELIDLNVYFLFNNSSQINSQGTISDVLDQMCGDMNENNLSVMTNVSKSSNKANEFLVNSSIDVNEKTGFSNDTNDSKNNNTDEQKNKNEIEKIHQDRDLEEFECILAAKCLGNKGDEIKMTNNNDDDVKTDVADIIANDDVIDDDLDEFECILAAKRLGNCCNKDDEIKITNNNVQSVKTNANDIIGNDDVVDLDEFDEILATQSNDCKEEDMINHICDKTNQIVDDRLNIDEIEHFLTTKYFKDSHEEENNNDMIDNNISKIDDQKVRNGNKETLLNEYIIESDQCKTENKNENDCFEAKNVYNSNMTNDDKTNLINISKNDIPSEFKIENKNKLNTVTDTEMFEDTIIISDSEDGYNSSDFEFITEDEASKAGLVTKLDKITNDNSNSIVNNNSKIASKSITFNDKIINSGRASQYNNIKYNKYRYQRCYTYSAENHVIPEGEQYLDMFRGHNAPSVMNNLYSMGNKNVMPSVLMAVHNEDLMFRGSEIVDEKYEKHKDDAKECINQILATYPHVNRRKRRRH